MVISTRLVKGAGLSDGDDSGYHAWHYYGGDCYPANQRESDIILEHLKGQPCKYQEIGLDGGYDIGGPMSRKSTN